MRLSVLVVLGGGLAAPAFGCAQVAGIQDVSSSTAVKHCVDTVNNRRVSAMLPAIPSWTDEQSCADQFAQAEGVHFAEELAKVPDAGLVAPPCAMGPGTWYWAEPGVSEADPFFQAEIDYIWTTQNQHGPLGSTGLSTLTCGYWTTETTTGGAFMYTFNP